MREIPTFLQHYLPHPKQRPWWTWYSDSAFGRSSARRTDGLSVLAYDDGVVTIDNFSWPENNLHEQRRLATFVTGFRHRSPATTNQHLDAAFPITRPPWCVGQIWAFCPTDRWTVVSIAKVSYRPDGSVGGIGLTSDLRGETYFFDRPDEPLLPQLSQLKQYPALLLHNPFGLLWASQEPPCDPSPPSSVVP